MYHKHMTYTIIPRLPFNREMKIWLQKLLHLMEGLVFWSHWWYHPNWYFITDVTDIIASQRFITIQWWRLLFQLIVSSWFVVRLFIVKLYIGTMIKVFIIRIQHHSFLPLEMIILLVSLYNTFFLVSFVLLINFLFVRIKIWNYSKFKSNHLFNLIQQTTSPKGW